MLELIIYTQLSETLSSIINLANKVFSPCLTITLFLDKSILFLAEKDQSIPNPNPLTKVSLVPYQKALVDVQANGAIYQEIVTQLELAKVTHRNKTPLIQIIDKPTLPLENSRLRFFECIVYGLFGGFVISIIYFSLIRFYQSLIK